MDWIQQEDRIAGQGPAKVSAVISPEVKPKPVQIRSEFRSFDKGMGFEEYSQKNKKGCLAFDNTTHSV